MPTRAQLMPVQPDGGLPLNYYDIEAPMGDRPPTEVVELPMTKERLTELTKKLTVVANGFTKSAQEKIEAAGGKIEVI